MAELVQRVAPRGRMEKGIEVANVGEAGSPAPQLEEQLADHVLGRGPVAQVGGDVTAETIPIVVKQRFERRWLTGDQPPDERVRTGALVHRVEARPAGSLRKGGWSPTSAHR